MKDPEKGRKPKSFGSIETYRSKKKKKVRKTFLGREKGSSLCRGESVALERGVTKGRSN